MFIFKYKKSFLIYDFATVLRIRIRMDSFKFGSRIRNKVESRIWIRIKVKTQEPWKFKEMELWRVVNTNNGDAKAQNGAVESLYTNSRTFAHTLMRSRIRIRTRINVKRRIRICIIVFWFRNTTSHSELFLLFFNSATYNSLKARYGFTQLGIYKKASFYAISQTLHESLLLDTAKTHFEQNAKEEIKKINYWCLERVSL